MLTKLKEEKQRFSVNSDTGEWTLSTVVSLFNKISVILEDFVVNADWSTGVRKYTKQKGLLTKNKLISGFPGSDDESDDARDQRRQLGEIAERRPAMEV